MQSFFSTSLKLGIIGGGQLGKMLLNETQKWDIYTCVLDPVSNAPCASICNVFTQGDVMDYDTVYNFGKNLDLITVETEHVNIQALYKLQDEGIAIYPQPEVLEIVQQGVQKEFLKKHAIPTAAFQRFESKENMLTQKFQFPVFWKAAQLGYDGNSVKRIVSYQDLTDLPDVSCIIEEFITIDKEFAILVARNKSGEIKTYPVVEMEFNSHIHQVEYVSCPAVIPDDLSEKIQQIALKTSKAFNHIGLMAIKFLWDKSGRVLVNEVAPRPHYSGHYSIEASYTNQFEQHLRAILDLPLGDTSSLIPAVTVNLVGEEAYVGEVLYQNMTEVLSWKGATPHIYGKKLTRAFRKMGHITVVDKDIKKAKETARKLKRTVRVTGKQQIACD